MIPADPKPSFQGGTRILEERRNADLRIAKAEDVDSETLKPILQYLKNDSRRPRSYEVRTSLGFTKEAYQREKEVLSNKLQTLITNARICKVAATQTVVSGVAAMPDDLNSKCALTEDRILDLIRNQDSQLAERILDLVEQKLKIQKNAEADLQLLQKNMENEKHTAIRRLKDEHRRHVEKLKRDHKMQLKSAESQYEMHVERFKDRIRRLQDERKILDDKFDNCERELRESKADSVKLQAENRMVLEENRMFRREIAKKRDTDENLQKSVRLIGELREKLKKSEEEKELILRQFRLLETERDELVDAIRAGIYKVEEANRLGDKLLAAEIARTKGQIEMRRREEDTWSSDADLASIE